MYQYEAEETETEPSRTMRLGWKLVWSLAFFGPAIAMGYAGQWLFAAILVAAAVGSFSGFRIGAFSIFTSLVAIGVAIRYAPELGMTHAYRFEQWFGTTGLANRFISIAVFGLVIAVVVTVLSLGILGRTIRHRRPLDRANRYLGFVVGGLQGTAAIVLFVCGMLVMESGERERAPTREASNRLGQFASKVILGTADAAKASPMGPMLVKYNPITRIPELNKIQEYRHTAEVISDPAKLNVVMAQPEIVELRQRPEIQKLVQELNDDPSISEVVQPGKPITREAAMRLLSHPAVMELVDQPGFLDQAAQAIKNAAQKASVAPALVH